MSQAVAAPSLFDKLGGAPAIEAVVTEFYKRVLADKELKGFFNTTDMDKQRRHQTQFISMALGGPNQYTGRSMKAAHADMKIKENHFNLVAGHLVETLKSFNISQADIDEVVSKVGPLKDDIVNC